MPTKQLYPDLGPHCSYLQAIYSETGIRKGVTDNTPNPTQYANMVIVHNEIFVPVGEHFGIYPLINSFFRNDATNTAVGGSKTSQHRNGQAMDLDYDRVIADIDNFDMFNFIRANLSFDQMIFEFFNPDGSPKWVHCSYVSKAKNRKQCLKAIKVKSKLWTPKNQIFDTSYVSM